MHHLGVRPKSLSKHKLNRKYRESICWDYKHQSNMELAFLDSLNEARLSRFSVQWTCAPRTSELFRKRDWDVRCPCKALRTSFDQVEVSLSDSWVCQTPNILQAGSSTTFTIFSNIGWEASNGFLALPISLHLSKQQEPWKPCIKIQELILLIHIMTHRIHVCYIMVTFTMNIYPLYVSS